MAIFGIPSQQIGPALKLVSGGMQHLASVFDELAAMTLGAIDAVLTALKG